MAFCLNTNAALILYTELTNSEYFVDKSESLSTLYWRSKSLTAQYNMMRTTASGQIRNLSASQNRTVLEKIH